MYMKKMTTGTCPINKTGTNETNSLGKYDASTGSGQLNVNQCVH